MKLFKSVGSFFALDIGTNAIRVVQLDTVGNSVWSLVHYGYMNIDEKLVASDSEESKQRLGEAILTVVGQSGISTRNVVLGLPSQKTFTTVVEVPITNDSELASLMKYQVDQHIPMSVDDAKIDWSRLGPSLRDPKMQEVLITSTAIEYTEDRLDFIEGLGFDVIAAEPDPIAMIRSLLPVNSQDAQLIVDMGEHSTNLALVYGDTPRLVRNIPTGLNTLVKTAVQNLNVKDEQAKQFILKFGLAQDRLEGQVYNALESTLDAFVSELTKSVKFFQTRYPGINVSRILMSGYGMSIPKFSDYVSTKSGLQAVQANPWQKVQVSQTDQQRILPVASEFATVVGLAQRDTSI